MLKYKIDNESMMNSNIKKRADVARILYTAYTYTLSDVVTHAGQVLRNTYCNTL